MEADDEGDGQGDRGVKPVGAADREDDRAGDRDARRRGGVGGGIEKHRLDVQLVAVLAGRAVLAAVVAAQDERARQHRHGRGGADDQHRQPLDPVDARRQVLDRGRGDPDVQKQQPARVDQRGDGRRAGVALWPGRQPDRQQRDPDRGGIREIVRACREDRERMRRQPHDDQSGDKRKVQEQDGGQPVLA